MYKYEVNSNQLAYSQPLGLAMSMIIMYLVQIINYG